MYGLGYSLLLYVFEDGTTPQPEHIRDIARYLRNAEGLVAASSSELPSRKSWEFKVNKSLAEFYTSMAYSYQAQGDKNQASDYGALAIEYLEKLLELGRLLSIDLEERDIEKHLSRIGKILAQGSSSQTLQGTLGGYGLYEAYRFLTENGQINSCPVSGALLAVFIGVSIVGIFILLAYRYNWLGIGNWLKKHLGRAHPEIISSIEGTDPISARPEAALADFARTLRQSAAHLVAAEPDEASA